MSSRADVDTGAEKLCLPLLWVEPRFCSPARTLRYRNVTDIDIRRCAVCRSLSILSVYKSVRISVKLRASQTWLPYSGAVWETSSQHPYEA
jgi:hypothetical protein